MVDNNYKDWKILSFTIGGLSLNVGSTSGESFKELQEIMDKYIREAKEFAKILPLSVMGSKELGDDGYE